MRLILDEDLEHPLLSSDEDGYVIRLPIPKRVKDAVLSLQGLFVDEDDSSWTCLWRLFNASLYHASLHAAYSDFSYYTNWAKGKHPTNAAFAVSLIEDLRVTTEAQQKWNGVLGDIAYANYVSGLRVLPVYAIEDKTLNFATELLLKVWGIAEEEQHEDYLLIDDLTRRVKSLIMLGVSSKEQEHFLEAADAVYSSVAKIGSLKEIPSLPHTEAHGSCDIFGSSIVEQHERLDMLESARLALRFGRTSHDSMLEEEAKEFSQSMKLEEQSRSKMRSKYSEIISTTRLEAVEFPKNDYGMFLRTRSELSGSIRYIRDQLRLVRNAMDESSGYESGQIDTQLAVQVVASGENRNDVFQREEPATKEEAWAILVDASRSVSSASREVRVVSTCLAEVAKDLIIPNDRWSLFAFNSTLMPIKDFDEPYSIESKARIGGLVQEKWTLLPDAIQACCRALSSRSAETKILMVVSDGYPTGYTDINNDLVSAVQKASRSGILMLGVGLTNPAILKYFNAMCPLESPSQMMRFFVKSYLSISQLF